jgi:hypothetical protein
LASLINQRIRFLHMPKTGGSWATESMFAAGVVAERPASMPFHAGLSDSRDFSDRFTFAFVRHPLEFWLSYWGYRMRTGWDLNHGIDAATSSDSFDEFIDAVIAHAPGAASAMYECFVGQRGQEIDFIGRHERLADDLCLALTLAGEDFSEARLRSHPPVNRTDFRRYQARYTRSAAERLVDLEGAAIERFYAHDPIPGRLLGRPAATKSAISRRLKRSELELREARAELAARSHSERRREALFDTREHELAQAQEALSMLRASRLVRWSRPLRTSWYGLRRRRSTLRSAVSTLTTAAGAVGSTGPRETNAPALCPGETG